MVLEGIHNQRQMSQPKAAKTGQYQPGLRRKVHKLGKLMQKHAIWAKSRLLDP
jgi:hypothetical protein